MKVITYKSQARKGQLFVKTDYPYICFPSVLSSADHVMKLSLDTEQDFRIRLLEHAK